MALSQVRDCLKVITGSVPRAFIANISELSTEDNGAVTASFFDGEFDTGRDDFVTYLRH